MENSKLNELEIRLNEEMEKDAEEIDVEKLKRLLDQIGEHSLTNDQKQEYTKNSRTCSLIDDIENLKIDKNDNIRKDNDQFGRELRHTINTDLILKGNQRSTFVL